MRNKQTIDEMMELEDYAYFRAELVELSPESFTVPSRFLRTFRQPPRPAVRCGYSSSSVTSR